MRAVQLRKVQVAFALAAIAGTAAAAPPARGYVAIDGDFADATTPAQYQRIDAATTRNLARLARGRALAPPPAQAAATADLRWPLAPVDGFDQPDYHGTKYFVDHDARFPGFVQDYTCGTRTYDLASGYNHAGTDYFLWPFPWQMMDAGMVRIVAAAPGVIVAKDDGNFDRNCAIASDGNPNYVRILQDDGLTATYLHMRSGSVTTAAVGARVAAGDYLGLVGSSGASSGPHLHFELRDASGAVVDPRHGQCNAAPDRWLVAQAYEDPRIDTLSTHSDEPQQVACGVAAGMPVDDVPHYADRFAPGDSLWVFASYSDQRNGEVTQFTIVRPDGSTFAQWQFDLASQNLPSPFYSGTSWDWTFVLPADAPPGAWTVQAVFQGRTYAHAFAVAAGAHFDAAAAGQARTEVGANATRCRGADPQCVP